MIYNYLTMYNSYYIYLPFSHHYNKANPTVPTKPLPLHLSVKFWPWMSNISYYIEIPLFVRVVDNRKEVSIMILQS